MNITKTDVMQVLKNEGGRAVVSSLDVARFFDKQHKDVLEKIRAEIALDEKVGAERNFRQSSYINLQNKKQPYYLMNRDGFMLLAMGFTGDKAALVKRLFIHAFNEMEVTIKTLISNPPITMLGYDNARMLSIGTRVDFQKMVAEIVENFNFQIITDAEYLAIFDRVAWQMRRDLGLPKGCNLREYLDEPSLRMIDYFETQIINALRLKGGKMGMAEFLRVINVIATPSKELFTILGLPITFGRVSDTERKARNAAKNKEKQLAKKAEKAQLETKLGVQVLY